MANILIIEDDYDGSRLMGHTLSYLGHKILHADSVAQGFDTLGQSPVDLIVLDMLLPDQSGVDFLKIVQCQPQISNIPVVVLTAHDRFLADRDLRGFENVQRIFIKPLGLRQLQEYVSEVFV